MDEEGVVRLSILDQPLHGSQDIILRGNTKRVFLIVRQNDHVLPSIATSLVEVSGHVGDIVDASPELIGLPDIVDSDQQRFPSTGTGGILEAIIRGRAPAKGLCLLGRPGRELAPGGRGTYVPLVMRGSAVFFDRDLLWYPRG